MVRHSSSAVRLGWGYRRYLLILLAALYAFNCVDRLALGLVLQDIKATFHLSDTELGVLTGIAFALFYSTLGIPIGRWADRGNRVTIIALSAGLWSVFVMLCGAATSFAQLLLIRIGVAVGEAGGFPPAYSLIGDYFTRAERPKAMGNYLLGAPLCIVIGYFAAGWLNQLYGWRVMFGVLGLPGVVLALLARLTLREPRLGGSEQSSQIVLGCPPPSMIVVARTLWAKRTFRHVLLMLSVNAFFGYGIAQWQPAFFIRSFGLSTGTLGTWLSVICGLTGGIGLYWGGTLASRYAAANEPLQLRVLALANCLFGVTTALIFLSPNAYVSFVLLSVGSLGWYLSNSPLFAIMQTIVPQRMRAVSVSIIYLFSNLIGMGLGPLAVGALSDALRPWLAEESLRYALLAMCPGYLWGAWHLWLGARTVLEDIDIELPQSERPQGSGAALAVQETGALRTGW